MYYSCRSFVEKLDHAAILANCQPTNNWCKKEEFRKLLNSSKRGRHTCGYWEKVPIHLSLEKTQAKRVNELMTLCYSILGMLLLAQCKGSENTF